MVGFCAIEVAETPKTVDFARADEYHPARIMQCLMSV
jgi:hypothetical protein